jgi:RHS repeat-associated protein
VLPANAATPLTASTTPGEYLVAATITDGYETITLSQRFYVADPNDTVGPEVSLVLPADHPEWDAVEITAPTEVTGLVTGADTARWVLAVQARGSDSVTVIAEGTGEFTERAIGTFDPTRLLNGLYVLVLQAYDRSGNVGHDSRLVRVTGDMKLGHYSITFEEVSIPVAGIPVTVTRTYDTRRAAQSLDFGHGWTVDTNNVRVQESRRLGFAWDVFTQGGTFGQRCIRPLGDPIVTVTLPDGEVASFKATAEPECQSFAGNSALVQLVFEPIDGTDHQLEQTDYTQLRWGTVAGQAVPILYDEIGGDQAPVDPRHYRLTTDDGLVYEIDQIDGVRQITDQGSETTLTYSRDGVRHSSGLGIDFVRDPQGRIRQLRLPDGETIDYRYSAVGDLEAVIDQAEHEVGFTYIDDARFRHYLEDTVDARGIRVSRNEYDDNGRLRAVIDAEGHRIEITHDFVGRTQTIKDRRGNSSTFVFDDAGRVLSQTNAEGETVTRTYDEEGNTLTETDALMHTTTRTFDLRGNLETETNPLDETTTQTYNAKNQLLTRTDPSDTIVLRNEYDVRSGQLLERSVDALGRETGFGYAGGTGVLGSGQLETITDAALAETRFGYDFNGFKNRETDALGHVVTYVNDQHGRVTSQSTTRTIIGANGTPSVETLTTTYTLDEAGRVTATTHPDGSVTTTDYNGNGQPTLECDGLQRCTQTRYTDRGEVGRIDYPDATFETKTYDRNGNLETQTDRAGRTTTFVYDKADRLTETIHPDETPADDSDNPRSISRYDDAGRLEESVDENGHATRYRYDDAGRRTEVIRTATATQGEATTVEEYDVTGRRTATTDAEGHRTEYRYDAAGRLTETIHPDDTPADLSDNPRSRVEFDAVGRKVAEIDEAGRTSRYAFDRLGRLTTVVLPDPATGANPPLVDGESPATGTLVTRYRYDEVGNKIEQIDAEGRRTRWEYDRMGRETARVLPEGQRETKQYNDAGELIASTDFNGTTTSYRYDAAGRLEHIDYATDADVSFDYNAAGERITVIDARGTSTAAFDRRGRVERVHDADGGIIEYTYDAAGNLESRVSPSQSLVYTYDARNRLESVTRTVDGEAPMSTRYEYDQDGNRSVMLGGDGTRTEYGYDRRHRLTSLVKKTAAGAVFLAMGYTVDASGMRTHVEESDTAGLTRVVTYTYDAVKRLTSETIDHRDDVKDRITAWTYDSVGNRLTQVLTTAGTSETTSYVYDDNDRLESETRTGPDAGQTVYTYDANGNTRSKTGPSGATTYAYDDANRLSEATTPQGLTSYAYNADGLRVRQTHTPVAGAPTTTWYVQDSAYPYAQVIEEYTSQGSGAKQLAATFTFADDLISQTRYETGVPVTHFVQADGFGSTRWLSDATGAITDKIDYDAFGNEIARTGTTDVEHLYRGERWDPNVAAYDLRARLYTPGNGRFLTQDSFVGFSQDPQSLHKYAYTHNNPINSIDPSGHFSMAEVGTSLRVMGHLAAIGIPTYNAVNNLRAGASLGETTLRFAAEVTIGYAGGAVLGRLTRFLPPILRIRSAGSLVPAGGRASQSMWNLGIYGRGEAAELAVLGGQRTLPWNYPVIDDFAGGFATSIKSMDLIGKSSSYIRSQMMASAEKLAAFVPRNYGAAGQLRGATVNGRNLVYVFEPGAADAAQAALLKQIAQEIKTAYPQVKLAFQWVP